MSNPRTVLIVEDDFLIRACLAEFLEDSGMTVLEAEGQRQATEIIDATPSLSIVISDISLPDGDGLSVGRIARARLADIPLIYISGYGSAGMEPTDPRTRFISKPYAMADVLDTIMELTRSVQAAH